MVLLAQDTTAAQVAAAVAATKKPAAMTLLQAIESGGWAMIPLALMSILTVMLILAYVITLRRNAVVSAHFMNTAEVLLKKRDYTGLLAIANRHSESVARVVRRMLDFASKNPTASFEVIREIAQTEGSAQAASLQHRITYLADIAVLSPMVGLLGTVMGIIRSFATIASKADEATRSGLLSGGVSEALFATAAGLIVGIVSMAFYGLYRNRVQSLISELEGASAHLLALLALNFERNDEKPREDRRERRSEDRRGEDKERAPAPSRRPAVSVDDEF
jgi:biopolymer transport protein ExbB